MMKRNRQQLDRCNYLQAQRRRHFQKIGLRCDGKPLAKARPCGCVQQSCQKCCRTEKKLAFNKLIAVMHADYAAGMSLGQVARKYPSRSGKPRGTSEVKVLFLRRGLPVRPTPIQCRHQLGNPGRFQSKPPKTPKQISDIIRQAKSICVPQAIHHEWRHWSLAKRWAFIKRLRRRFPSLMPKGPYYGNVTPFNYGTPAAHKIAATLNAGKPSRHWVVNLKLISEGLIYRGELYFFSYQYGFARWGSFYVNGGRPLLHHVIYTKHHGPIPPSHTVIFKDGNKNNFNPSNLALRSRERCAEQNHWKHRPLLIRQRIINRIAVKTAISKAANSRRQVKTLLISGAIINTIKYRS